MSRVEWLKLQDSIFAVSGITAAGVWIWEDSKVALLITIGAALLLLTRISHSLTEIAKRPTK